MNENEADDVVHPDVLPPAETDTPPPMPPQKTSFWRKLWPFRPQRPVAMGQGGVEVLELIRAIREHLDRQETVQAQVADMLSRLPEAVERQNEVLYLFREHLANSTEKDRTLTEGLTQLGKTLEAMEQTQKASSRAVTDMVQRSRETEDLLGDVMRRAERRVFLAMLLMVLFGGGMAFWLGRQTGRPDTDKGNAKRVAATAAIVEEPAPRPAPPSTAAFQVEVKDDEFEDEIADEAEDSATEEPADVEEVEPEAEYAIAEAADTELAANTSAEAEGEETAEVEAEPEPEAEPVEEAEPESEPETEAAPVEEETPAETVETVEEAAEGEPEAEPAVADEEQNVPAAVETPEAEIAPEADAEPETEAEPATEPEAETVAEPAAEEETVEETPEAQEGAAPAVVVKVAELLAEAEALLATPPAKADQPAEEAAEMPAGEETSAEEEQPADGEDGDWPAE